MQPGRLSPRAAALLAGAGPGGVAIASVSFWELAVKVRNGALALPWPVATLAERFTQVAAVEMVPIDAALWLASVDLAWDHRDPVDRLLVALAERRGAPLLTRDRAILDHYDGAVW